MISKKFYFVTATLLLSVWLHAQQAQKKIYNPEADAKKEIAAAVSKAKAANKNVFLQLGGNWCIWCLRFDSLVNANDTLKNFMNQNYEVVHVNYSSENKNEQLLAELGYPQRFGFPVFVVLDANGNRLHTQNSEYLEKGKGHDTKVVLNFLKNWAPSALDPEKYKPR